MKKVRKYIQCQKMGRGIWQKVRHWFWWNFIATNDKKIFWQQIMCGTGIGKIVNGKRKFVDIRKFYKKLND